ncbi:MAG: (d)CMP kinase [Blastochloris sp.]|nr:(d)CMP kinase [Blastochloris sp.]
MLHPVIAIDGPAASGKSTVARLLAQKLNFVYVDTGAMYRTYAWLAIEKKIDPSDRAAVKKLLQHVRLGMTVSWKKLTMLVDDIDPTPHIRSEEINQAVSKIAAVPELREFLVIAQRKLRSDYPLVMEGRDIGTVVFTDTPHKFFLDADPEIRNQRRQLQGQTDAISNRDQLDRNRSVAPLIKAADAMPIDATYDSAEVIADRLHALLQERGIHPASLP